MRLVLGTSTLDSPGGSESYIVTVAEQLARLGHDVALWTRRPGLMASAAVDRGLEVLSDGGMPDSADGLITQDAEAAYRLREEYPYAPSLYVLHSTHFTAQDPPALDGVADVLVAMNDRILARAESSAASGQTVRLRQPVDLMRFRWAAQRSRARRVLVLGNHYGDQRLAPLRAACDSRGLELTIVGGAGGFTLEPQRDIAAADIVAGVGRCIVEAMVAGRAAFVFGNDGVDGWVTPESYARLEADGFSGRAGDELVEPAAVSAALAEWHPEMGQANRELGVRNHDAAAHAAELVELLGKADGDRPAPAAPLDELARMARLAGGLESRLLAAELQTQRLAAELDREVTKREATEQSATYRFARRLQRVVHRVRRD